MRNCTTKSMCRDRTVTSDRLGRQDKSRKVRPVGWFGFVRNFKCASNIAETQQKLRSLPSCRSRSVFVTLWWPLHGDDEFARSSYEYVRRAQANSSRLASQSKERLVSGDAIRRARVGGPGALSGLCNSCEHGGIASGRDSALIIPKLPGEKPRRAFV
jgi:hypothetical protein